MPKQDFTVIDLPARPKRGRPRSRLMLPHERPRAVRLPFDAAETQPTPEHQAALKHFLQWMSCAEMEARPDDRRQAAEEALNALHAGGLQVRDLLEAAR